jgi:hypothetical protein
MVFFVMRGDDVASCASNVADETRIIHASTRLQATRATEDVVTNFGLAADLRCLITLNKNRLCVRQV